MSKQKYRKFLANKRKQHILAEERGDYQDVRQIMKELDDFGLKDAYGDM